MAQDEGVVGEVAKLPVKYFLYKHIKTIGTYDNYGHHNKCQTVRKNKIIYKSQITSGY